MSNIPLRRRPLKPGRGRAYRAKFTERMLFMDYRTTEGVIYGAHAESLAEALAWIDRKAKEDCRARLAA